MVTHTAMVGGLEVEVGRRDHPEEAGRTVRGRVVGGRGLVRQLEADGAGHGAVIGTALEPAAAAGGCRPPLAAEAAGEVAAGAAAGLLAVTLGDVEPAEPLRKKVEALKSKGKSGIHPVPRAQAAHLKTNHPSKC